MTIWANRVVKLGPRNGTTSHAIDPSSATDVVLGTQFSPTAGRFLVVFAYGGVTSTTPAGWTLPTGGSAINNGGLYVWYRTAAGGDTFSSTANASNYAVYFDVMEFGSGSAFLAAAASTAVASGGAGPTLSMSAGTKLIFGVLGEDLGTGATGTASWSTGVEDVDLTVASGGAPVTDGLQFGVAYLEDSTSTSQSMAASFTGTSSYTGGAERLMFAVTAVAAAAAKRNRHDVTANAVRRASLY